MWRVVRLTLMWLLAVALPLQGVSAATMISCGMGRHDHFHSHMAGHAHRSDIAAGDVHSHGADASQHGHVDADRSGHDKPDLGIGVIHKCSACASCCMSAVVPSETVFFDTVKLTDFFAPLVARSVAAYVTEGLERPPRLFLA